MLKLDRIMLALTAILSSAASLATPRPSTVSGIPLQLNDVQAHYDALVGRRIAIQGFVVFRGSSRPLLMQGEARPGFLLGRSRGMEGRIGFGCTFWGQPEPLQLRDLSRHDLWQLSRRARYASNMLGQRAVVEGVLRPRSARAARYGATIDRPAWDQLAAVRIVRVENVFCRGHQFPPN